MELKHSNTRMRMHSNGYPTHTPLSRKGSYGFNEKSFVS